VDNLLITLGDEIMPDKAYPTGCPDHEIARTKELQGKVWAMVGIARQLDPRWPLEIGTERLAQVRNILQVMTEAAEIELDRRRNLRKPQEQSSDMFQTFP
jgi:hypothetical protein